MGDPRAFEPVEGKLPGTDRTIRIYFQRTDWKEFYDFTTGEMKDAAREIETAFKHYTGAMGYGIMDVNRTDKSHDGSEVLSNHLVQVLKTYDDWSKDRDNKHKGIVLDVCAFGFTYREVAEQRNSSPATIMRKLQEGLGLYASLRGWGKKSIAAYETKM